MNVRELYAELEKRFPHTLSCEWDNDGLLLCPNGQKEVKRVLIALDVTDKTVEYAISGGYDCIISHHPFIFRGLKAINDAEAVSAKAIRLIGAGISVMSFHTRLDAASGGVNDTLCDILEIVDTQPLFDGNVPLGRIGDLKEPMTAERFAKRVKDALDSPFVLLSDAGVNVSRVAVVGGSGKDVIETARVAGADTFVSGRFDYHPMTDAPEHKSTPMNLIEAGHFYTEAPVCAVLAETVCEIATDIFCDIYSSNVIKAI